MHLKQIINSLLETDLYKYSMGMAIYHQFPSYTTTWTFKCRNEGVVFTKAMVNEIIDQICAYCDLRYTKDELAYLSGITWMKPDYIDFLRLWRPNIDDFDIRYDERIPCHLSIETTGTWLNTSMYEIPILAIVNEVYFKMKYRKNNLDFMPNPDGALDFSDLMADFNKRLTDKFHMIASNRWYAGTFSEFGLRRRLCAEAQENVIKCFAELADFAPDCRTKFIGTSNVYLAKKYDVKPVGTMAHEFIMCVGQGNHKHNPAYSNWYALEAWVKEYGILNGTALTDTITTDVFLRDFQLTYATLFSGVRHDSGDPIEWGEKILAHYRKLGINPITKTLLFSDSLNFQATDKIYRHFQDRCQVAFGIGTYLSNDTCVNPLNIVMKVTACNGQDVAKISDTPGKGMCKNPDYVDYLQRALDWRLQHESI